MALNMALKEVCDFEISEKEHYERFNGLPTKLKLTMLVEDGKIDKQQIELVEKLKQEHTLRAIDQLAHLRQEKIELMRCLKNKNIKIACYTNSIRMTAELMLKKTGVFEYLDILVTNQDVVCPKPSPEGYNIILNKLNILSNDAIIIEDSPKGIEAARNSGCKVIEVKNPDMVNIELLEELL